jgi:hypothetical protein
MPESSAPSGFLCARQSITLSWMRLVQLERFNAEKESFGNKFHQCGAAWMFRNSSIGSGGNY